MNITRLKLASIPQFSHRDIAYVNEIEALQPYFKYSVNIDSFEQVISDKSQEYIDRALLANTLNTQYAYINTSNAVKSNIELLRRDNTFTIITAHQPSLMTGPGYYFYKIFSTLNLVKQLSLKYQAYNFVPIFITGSEDHDFEEINHFSIYGKSIKWESNQKGSVGKFELDSAFDNMLEEFMQVAGDHENVQALKQEIQTARDLSQNYGQFAIRLTDLLFQNQGLVVLDMSAKALKEAFIPVMKKEIFQQASISFVESTQSALEAVGIKQQAFARPINFFYTGSGDRLRIEQKDDQYIIVGTDITFTQATLNKAIEETPEHFSPNVIMRPIYQEYTLPNLAYIGGGGEIAYWLERQSQFKEFGINFPMLIRRNSGMILDKGSSKKMSKLGLILTDLFGNVDSIIASYLKRVSGNNLNYDDELQKLGALFSNIAAKAKSIDPGLEGKVLAEGSKIAKQVDQLTSRIKRAAKQNEETSVNQIQKIKGKLFPGMSLQERKSCFLEYIIKHDLQSIDELIPYYDPLQKTMIVIEE